MYRYSVPCNPRITLAAFLAHFFLQDYREGATPFAPAGRFQSTCPRRGTTIPDSKLEDSDDWFQSTLPRGERLEWYAENFPEQWFQSTLPRGERRGAPVPIRYNRKKFQSTLPRGERHSPSYFCFLAGCFNPRSHEGSDGNMTLKNAILLSVSIHAPTRGATAICHLFMLFCF